MTLSVEEIRVIDTLVREKGFLRTHGKLFTGWKPADICTPLYTAVVKRKIIKKLYKKEHLLSQRVTSDRYGDNVTIWEVYKPRLQKYECFQELIVQDALGTGKTA